MKKLVFISLTFVILFNSICFANNNKYPTTNERWLKNYKTAAMINDDKTNLDKVEFICKHEESELFWESIEFGFKNVAKRNGEIFCFDECYVQTMTNEKYWKYTNKRIDNFYKNLKSQQ